MIKTLTHFCVTLGLISLCQFALAQQESDLALVGDFDELLNNLKLDGFISSDDLAELEKTHGFDFTYAFAQSGDIRGNGGDIVVCSADNPFTAVDLDSYEDAIYSLFDYVEGKQLRGFTIKPKDKGFAPVSDYISIALSRLAKFDPARARRYAIAINQLLANSRFVDVELQDIADQGEIPVKICTTWQAAVQVKPKTPHDKRFLFNKSAWGVLDNFNKAGLLLHEVIYSDALMYGHNNSVFARYFNSLLVSDELNNLSLVEYAETLETIGMYGQDYYTEDYVYFVSKNPAKDTDDACQTEDRPAELSDCQSIPFAINSHFGEEVSGNQYWCKQGRQPASNISFKRKTPEIFDSIIKSHANQKVYGICRVPR